MKNSREFPEKGADKQRIQELIQKSSELRFRSQKLLDELEDTRRQCELIRQKKSTSKAWTLKD